MAVEGTSNAIHESAPVLIQRAALARDAVSIDSLTTALRQQTADSHKQMVAYIKLYHEKINRGCSVTKKEVARASFSCVVNIDLKKQKADLQSSEICNFALRTHVPNRIDGKWEIAH